MQKILSRIWSARMINGILSIWQELHLIRSKPFFLFQTAISPPNLCPHASSSLWRGASRPSSTRKNNLGSDLVVGGHQNLQDAPKIKFSRQLWDPRVPIAVATSLGLDGKTVFLKDVLNTVPLVLNCRYRICKDLSFLLRRSPLGMQDTEWTGNFHPLYLVDEVSSSSGEYKMKLKTFRLFLNAFSSSLLENASIFSSFLRMLNRCGLCAFEVLCSAYSSAYMFHVQAVSNKHFL